MERKDPDGRSNSSLPSRSASLQQQRYAVAYTKSSYYRENHDVSQIRMNLEVTVPTIRIDARATSKDDAIRQVGRLLVDKEFCLDSCGFS